MSTTIKVVLAALLAAIAFVLGAAVALIGVLLRAVPIIIAVLICVWVLTGCTANVTIDNSVIDQSDVTQVLGCATDSVYELGE